MSNREKLKGLRLFSLLRPKSLSDCHPTATILHPHSLFPHPLFPRPLFPHPLFSLYYTLGPPQEPCHSPSTPLV